ncbi:MAG: hypothetical protein QOJ57_787 [Thermoleophilaceae bacterium]|nr:hypothetical protein [Thermoleophilaceae bacterium]
MGAMEVPAADATAPAEKPCFCGSAKIAMALAATAMPFASTHSEEAERWLRILRVNGAVGNAMQGLGLPEEPLELGAPVVGDDPCRPDSIDSVITAATAECRKRGRDAITTADLFVGVLSTYGPAFEKTLAVRGTTSEEVLDLVTHPRINPLAVPHMR